MTRSDFFGCLFSDTVYDIELRALPSKKTIFTRDINTINTFCEENEGENIYFGVGTRKGMRGKKENVMEIPALYVDVDLKRDRDSDNSVLRDLASFVPEPSVIVDSGGGFHAYWLLETPFKPAIEIEPYLKGLCGSIGGDGKAAECARILRVPNTINTKYPREVRIVSCNPALRYDINAFSSFRDNAKQQNISTSGEQPTTRYAENLQMKPCVEGMLETSLDKGHISRDAISVAIISELMRLGFEDDIVMKKVLLWNDKNVKPIRTEKLIENVRGTLKKDYRYSCHHFLLKTFCPYDSESLCPFSKGLSNKKYFNNRAFLQYGWQQLLNNAPKDVYYIAIPELERRRSVGAGGRIFANHIEIAKWAGIAPKTVGGALDELSSRGLVRITMGTSRGWEKKATEIQRILPIPKPPSGEGKTSIRGGRKVNT